MNAAHVHAVIAGGLSDTRLLAQWLNDPQSLRGLGVEPSELDLQALRSFAGLALKVRHNALRDAFVYTFRLLSVAGLEIELFADYALAAAVPGTALASSNQARAQQLVEFIRLWHDAAQPVHSVLWDLVRHENSVLQIRQSAATEHAPVKPARPGPGSVPYIVGTALLHEMQHDPRIIVQAMQQRVPDLGAIESAPCSLCYWRPPGESAIQIVELDAFGFNALRATDGRRNVRELAAALGLERSSSTQVLRLLVALQEAGLLAFSDRSAGRRP